MCTSIMVGKKAADPELIMIARNEDYTRNNWNKYLVYRKYSEYYNNNPVVNNGIWTLGNGLKVKVPEKMYSYSAMPDAAGYEESTYAIGNRYYFEERGINICNVAISATNSMGANDLAKEADPFVTVGIAESIIPTLILPQAETAADAVNLLGKYVEEYGASECNGILIGDPYESWYFEIGSCHHWIAVRIPEDAYIVIANSMRIHSINLEDKYNIRHSKDLYEFVRSHKLLETEELDYNNFNFAKAFGILGDPYNVDRIWLAQHMLTPSIEQAIREMQYPLFLKPDNKIQISNIMSVLRANYKGTKLEGKADRPIGVDRTAESHIITIDPKMNDELKCIIWQAIGTPLGSPYMPLYSVLDDIPKSYSIGNNEYSSTSAYWAFKELYALGSHESNVYKGTIHGIWSQYEQTFIKEQKYLNTILKEMYNEDRNTAIDFARRYSTGIAYELVDIANKERNQLITEITEKQIENLGNLPQ